MSAPGTIATQAPPTGKVGWLAALRRPYVVAPSAIVLVGANLIPLIGVMYWGWDLFSLMALYWIETGIIGFFTILHLALVAGWGALFLVPFFIVHFGGFMGGHLVFLWSFFAGAWGTRADSVSGTVWAIAIESGLWIAIAALFVSHSASFVLNVLRPAMREWRGLAATGEAQKRFAAVRASSQPQNVMMAPYGRIMVMHVTILLGAALAAAFESSFAPFVLLIALKIVTDVASHVRKNFAPAVTTTA